MSGEVSLTFFPVYIDIGRVALQDFVGAVGVDGSLDGRMVSAGDG